MRRVPYALRTIRTTASFECRGNRIRTVFAQTRARLRQMTPTSDGTRFVPSIAGIANREQHVIQNKIHHGGSGRLTPADVIRDTRLHRRQRPSGSHELAGLTRMSLSQGTLDIRSALRGVNRRDHQTLDMTAELDIGDPFDLVEDPFPTSTR